MRAFAAWETGNSGFLFPSTLFSFLIEKVSNYLVPRSAPIPDFERQICARFRQARERAKLKQATLARAVGISPDRLAGYEHGRNPIPYRIGAHLAERMNACQRWLVSGELPINPYLPVDPVVDMALLGKPLFSVVYFVLLSGEAEVRLKHAAKKAGKDPAKLEREDFHSSLPLVSPPLVAVMQRLESQLDTLKQQARMLDRRKVAWLIFELKKLSEKPLILAAQRRHLSWEGAVESERSALSHTLRAVWENWLGGEVGKAVSRRGFKVNN